MTESDDELEAEVNDATGPALIDWWQGVLAVERAHEPDSPEIIRRMQLNGLIDPDNE